MDADRTDAAEILTREPAEGLAATLDLQSPAGVLPPLWHWVYLLERTPQRGLGADGHALAGVPHPPGPGYRRMFGGGRVTTHALLRLGEPASRRTELVSSREKQGRSGPLVIATVRSEFVQGGVTAIVDESDIVYRAPGEESLPARGEPGFPRAGSGAATSAGAGPTPNAEPTPDTDAPGGAAWSLVADEALLFRFSALTFNAHRIHYDLPFCEREGYDGLVIHGPLQALLMGELMRREGVELVGRTFAYRFVAPLTGVQRILVEPAEAGLAAGGQVRSASGVVTARAELR